MKGTAAKMSDLIDDPGYLAQVDQFYAAVGEVSQGMAEAAEKHGMVVGPVDEDWLEELVDEAETVFINGPARTCGHLSNPQPTATASWAMGRYACINCAESGIFLPQEDDELVCERCRVDCPDTFHIGVVAVGPLICSFSLCEDCAHTEAEDTGGRSLTD